MRRQHQNRCRYVADVDRHEGLPDFEQDVSQRAHPAERHFGIARVAENSEADVINALREAKLAYQRSGPRLLRTAVKAARDYGMGHEQIATELNMTRQEVAAVVPE